MNKTKTKKEKVSQTNKRQSTTQPKTSGVGSPGDMGNGGKERESSEGEPQHPSEEDGKKYPCPLLQQRKKR
jgi:hypothetical protein